MSGWDVIDSSWLVIVIAGVAALLLLLDAFGGDAFARIQVPGLATFLAGMPLFYVALFIIAVDGRRWGVWVALGLSAGALLLAAASWALDRRG
ncbi:MAG: hypothetical protein MUE51_06790 [Thermoleophilia bacterium]|nr:hypothetical protein [Thermoleophilia bacterium]